MAAGTVPTNPLLPGKSHIFVRVKEYFNQMKYSTFKHEDIYLPRNKPFKWGRLPMDSGIVLPVKDLLTGKK